MNIKELNKLIKEELDAFLENEDEMGDSMDMGDDIEVTTDEPTEEENPIDLLRQIYDMLKPIVEPEEEVEDLEDEGDEEDLEDEDSEEVEEEEEEIDENLDHPNYRADYVKDVTHNAGKLKGGLNESVDFTARFKKLANIK
jgi:hypothetical protein|tara:strand:- start:1430 stop:1852 length:423 start_codon:yes stop_codon:yes gene_type:complete